MRFRILCVCSGVGPARCRNLLFELRVMSATSRLSASASSAGSVGDSTQRTLKRKWGKGLEAAHAQEKSAHLRSLSSLTPNPCPRRHTMVGLKFINRSQCCGCNNYNNRQSCRGRLGAIKTELDEDDTGSQRSEWVRCVTEYEPHFDEREGKQLCSKDGLLLQVTVVAVAEKGTKGETLVGIFWPIWLMKRSCKEVLEEEIDTCDGDRGVGRDPEPGGDLRGTTRVVTYSDKKMQRKTTVASSDTVLETAKLGARTQHVWIGQGQVIAEETSHGEVERNVPISSPPNKASSPSRNGKGRTAFSPVSKQHLRPCGWTATWQENSAHSRVAQIAKILDSNTERILTSSNTREVVTERGSTTEDLGTRCVTRHHYFEQIANHMLYLEPLAKSMVPRRARHRVESFEVRVCITEVNLNVAIAAVCKWPMLRTRCQACKPK